jgi:hypothetical protein
LGKTLSSPKAPIPWTEVLGYKNTIAGRVVINISIFGYFIDSKESEETCPLTSNM